MPMTVPTMLRIDETSKTLVAPTATEYVPEDAPARDELHALISGGWDAFAGEIGRPGLKAVGAAPEPSIDLLAVSEDGRVTVVTVADGPASDALGRALAAGAAVAGWDADKLGAVHEALQTAIPGDSPRLVIIGAHFDAASLATADWLVRRHGLELTAYGIQALRLGSERMMNIVATYPPAEAPEFVAAVAGAPAVPPPGAPAPAAPEGIPAPPA